MRLAALSLGFCVLLAHSARAGEVCHTVVVSPQTTNFSTQVDVPRFDSSLGQLQSVSFRIDGLIDGSYGIENLGGKVTSEAVFGGRLELERPDGSVIVALEVSDSASVALAAYDGTTDFRGPSGSGMVSYSLAGSATGSSPPPASDFDLFTGEGTVGLLLAASGTFSSTGSSGFVITVQSQASASLTICYEYENRLRRTYTRPLTGLSWQQTTVVDSFDPGLGSLACVEFVLDTDTEGEFGIESLDSAPIVVTFNRRIDIEVRRPDGTVLSSDSISEDIAVSLAAYDGTTDFMGPSGFLGTLGPRARRTVSFALTGSSDLALFTGPGVVTLEVVAMASSSFTAASGPVVFTDEHAGASFTVSYLFDAIETYCESQANSTGVPARISWSGTSSISANDLVLELSQLPPGPVTTGIFATSLDPAFFPLGDGNLCIGTQALEFIQRGAPSFVADVGGFASVALDNNSPLFDALRVDPGETWHYQALYRDFAAMGTGFNLSDGLRVTYCP